MAALAVLLSPFEIFFVPIYLHVVFNFLLLFAFAFIAVNSQHTHTRTQAVQLGS